MTDAPIVSAVVPAGFPSLAPLLQGGFRAGELVVLGGDAGSGSSSLALAFALRASLRSATSMFLSGEHPAHRVFEAALASSARVPLTALRGGALSDEEGAAITEAAASLRANAPLLLPLGQEGIVGVHRLLDDAPPVQLVVIDSLECLLTDATDRDDALAFAVLSCKRLALARSCVVLLTAHLPMLDRARSNLRPLLHDFGVRGAVAAHADLVLGLFREEIYHRDLALGGAAELYLLKNRTGDLGYVDLYYDAQCLRFEDVIEA